MFCFFVFFFFQCNFIYNSNTYTTYTTITLIFTLTIYLLISTTYTYTTYTCTTLQYDTRWISDRRIRPNCCRYLCFVLHVVLVCFCQFFNCFKFSLASSKFECISFRLSAIISIDWKLRFILLYTYIWLCSRVKQDDQATSGISMAASAKIRCRNKIKHLALMALLLNFTVSSGMPLVQLWLIALTMPLKMVKCQSHKNAVLYR